MTAMLGMFAQQRPDHSMDLQSYLDRIGFSGTAKADTATFVAVHRAHALSLCYENLDVQLGAPMTRDPIAAFDKIVRRGRGGWCYELNGLLGWALGEIGFDIKQLAGGVMRDQFGDVMVGNHLVLLVRLNGDEWIADVGFGDGLIEPARLREGPTGANLFDSRLEKVDGDWWRFSNAPRTGGPTFDFQTEAASDALLEEKSRFLQTDPTSPFVMNAVLQRWRGNEHLSLRGRVLRRMAAARDEKSLIQSADDYVRTIRDTFAIDIPEAASLWPAICARHESVFGGDDPLK